jgi:peptidoglycan/LPS O-acetylase OafA/YrhL
VRRSTVHALAFYVVVMSVAVALWPDDSDPLWARLAVSLAGGGLLLLWCLREDRRLNARA